jgi:copper chaperone CopZ
MRNNTMKTLLLLASLLVVVLTKAGPSTPPAKTRPNATNELSIRGMHCKGCAAGIAAELRLTPGVSKADVSLTNQLAVVAIDTNRVDAATLIRVIREAGYEASLKSP